MEEGGGRDKGTGGGSRRGVEARGRGEEGEEGDRDREPGRIEETLGEGGI